MQMREYHEALGVAGRNSWLLTKIEEELKEQGKALNMFASVPRGGVRGGGLHRTQARAYMHLYGFNVFLYRGPGVM
jgi:hypothetical protein